jgi:hypothetical protein
LCNSSFIDVFSNVEQQKEIPMLPPNLSQSPAAAEIRSKTRRRQNFCRDSVLVPISAAAGNLLFRFVLRTATKWGVA